MKRWGSFTAAGSAVFTAIAASAGFLWAEDEFWPQDPQSPRLSDPDSDALYALPSDSPVAITDDVGDQALSRGSSEPDSEHETAHVADVGASAHAEPDGTASRSTLDIAPLSAPADDTYHPSLRAERSDADGAGAGLLRSARNDDSYVEHDALAPVEPAILLASAPAEPSSETAAPAPSVEPTALEPAARAFASSAAAVEPAPAARPLVMPVMPASATLAAPQPAPLQIADAAPAPPADLAAHLEQKSSPVGGGKPPKAAEGAHQEARSNAQPLSRRSSSAPPPSAFQTATSLGGGGFASASPLDIPTRASVEYPAAPRVAAAVSADATMRVQSPSQLSPTVPAPPAFQGTSASGGGFASGSPLDIPAHTSVEYAAPPGVSAAAPAKFATPVMPAQAARGGVQSPSQPFQPPPSAFQADTSPEAGGFTSSSALDVFAPPEQPATTGSATPPLLTPASYSPLPAISQSYSDSESGFDANPRGAGGASSTAPEGEVLVLAPVVNGTPVNQVITVERHGSGYSLLAEDLRAFRVILDPSIKDGDTVALSSLPGVEANYVNASQSLELKIPDALLVPTEVQGQAGRTAISLSKIATTSGLLFNYRLFGTAETGGLSRNRAQLTGDTELVGMTRFGLFVTNGFFASSGRKTFVRGDSYFRFDDNAHVRSYTVGDVASGAVSFSRSVRLGGVQVQSDFQQRPDLFTGPLPRFAGSAALPSSIDLYVDSLKVFSTNVPQGPFILRSLPQISGNELRIVTTDANGRQTEVTTAYFNAPGLLRNGLVEYSAELGAPRIDSGLRSFGYRSQIFGSVTGRYGLGNRLTVEGHAETGGGLVNGGIGFIQALGKLGSLNGSAAASNYRGKQGTRLSAQYRFDQKRFSLFANVEREYGRYFDLGDVSSFRGPITDPAGLPLFPVRQRQSFERIGVSYRPAFDPVSFNVAYNHLRQGNSEIRTANLALRRRITDRISFNGNAILDLEKRHDVALSIGLDVRLGANARAFVGADRSNGRTNYNVSATGFGGGRQNALGYSISQRGNDDGDAFRSASVNYRFAQAFVAGTIDQSGSNVRGSLQLEGSLIAAGKDVFLANRVGEGFAVVKNAGPHVDILQGGRKIATSNGKGRALLPSLEPFSETRVSIDPATLPADLEAENGTDFRVVTARRRAALVDFGVRKVNAAIVVIFGKDGKPIPAGTQINLVGVTEPGLMGYDGEAFLKDLRPQNRINIDLGPAGKCSATFSYDINGEAQPRIGPITCS